MVHSCLWFLVITRLSSATFPYCTSTTTAASSTNASDVPVEVNIQGQSGKFTLVPRGSSGNSVGR